MSFICLLLTPSWFLPPQENISNVQCQISQVIINDYYHNILIEKKSIMLSYKNVTRLLYIFDHPTVKTVNCHISSRSPNDIQLGHKTPINRSSCYIFLEFIIYIISMLIFMCILFSGILAI
jgi:hypothetical protein